MSKDGQSTGSWLITGGCGFIGTNLVATLLEKDPDARIRILDNLSSADRDNLASLVPFRERAPDSLQAPPRGVELVVGDIRDPEVCRKSCTGIDVIVHLAANIGVPFSVENPVEDMLTNVNGTLYMLEAARIMGVPRFVFASSGAPLGQVEPPIHEEKAPRPVSPYGASKLAGEGYCSAYNRTFGIKTISLRFGNVYGPASEDKSDVVSNFIRRALAGEVLEIYGDGNQTRDFIHISDTVQAILLAAQSDAGGEVFQIATFRETSVNEIASMLQRLIKKHTGGVLKIDHGQIRAGDVRRYCSDISRARHILGFEPRVGLEEGLEDTLRFFLMR